MSLPPHTAIPIPHKYTDLQACMPWLRSPMESWVQLPPAHAYASPHMTKVRGVVQKRGTRLNLLGQERPRAAARRGVRDGHGWL